MTFAAWSSEYKSNAEVATAYTEHSVTLLKCSGWLSIAFSSHTLVHLYTILCCGKCICSVCCLGISHQSTEKKRNIQLLLKLKTTKCNALADNWITTFVITYCTGLGPQQIRTDHSSNLKAEETMDIQKENWKPMLSLQPAVQNANYFSFSSREAFSANRH